MVIDAANAGAALVKLLNDAMQRAAQSRELLKGLAKPKG